MKTGDKIKVGPFGYRKTLTITKLDDSDHVELYNEWDEETVILTKAAWLELLEDHNTITKDDEKETQP